MLFVGQLVYSVVSNALPAHLVGVRREEYIMNSDVLLLAQSFIDIMAWFLLPFAIMLGISWVASFFRS